MKYESTTFSKQKLAVKYEVNFTSNVSLEENPATDLPVPTTATTISGKNFIV
jgi:hypothetical protein